METQPHINILEEIKAIKGNTSARKFTLVLGSGFHKQAIGNSFCLSNWDQLLLQLGSKSCFNKNYILQFEELILDRAKKEKDVPAHVLEAKLLADVQDILKNESLELDLHSYDKLSFLFNPELVSDIISLNYDSLAEKICIKELNHLKKVEWENKNSCAENLSLKSKARIRWTTDYRSIGNTDEKSIRFWYPHGNIRRKNSIVLGVHKYSQLLISFDSIRNHYKKKEKAYFGLHKKPQKIDWDSIDLSWYSQLLNNPVIFLGASLSDAEWDLWTAITHAKRNFAKDKNTEYSHNMYIMLDKDQKCHPNTSSLKPLFAGMSYKEQWVKLKFYFEMKL
ncbi:MAG: hypothetical protein RL092_991 [Bacteroidota bacterium]|jgi:hypothetical protein